MAEKFWILESPQARSARWDKGNLWRKSDYFDYLHDDAGSGKYISYGGPANRISELRVVLQSSNITDFCWTLTDCLVRNQILEMVHEMPFTGYEARRAIVRWDPSVMDSDVEQRCSNPADDYKPLYWELLVTGWGGLASEESGVTRIANTNTWEGFPDWSRIVDWNTWDGSDFFIVWPFAFTLLVTDKVAEFIKSHKLSGVRLTTPDEYTRRHVLSKPGQVTPMRLRDHFPDDRARQIGEALNIY